VKVLNISVDDGSEEFLAFSNFYNVGICLDSHFDERTDFIAFDYWCKFTEGFSAHLTLVNLFEACCCSFIVILIGFRNFGT